jgi:cyclic pyranopterin phosphate synthase
VDYEFIDGRGDLGIIASVTEPFCSTCTRARLTADGKLVTCLFSQTGHDLKALLRQGRTDSEILDVVGSIWRTRSDRYSADRLEALASSTGYDPKSHKKIEMITLGG